VRGLVLVDQHDQARAQQAETDSQHADHGAGAEPDLHGRVTTGLVGGGRNAQVRLHRQRHAEVAHGRGEARTHQEEHGAAEAHTHVVGGQGEQRHERDRGKDAERPELPAEVGLGPLLHRLGDGLHVLGAFASSQNLVAEHRRHAEGPKGDHGDDDDEREVGAVEDWLDGKPAHGFSSV
jgi:hypothetical protein